MAALGERPRATDQDLEFLESLPALKYLVVANQTDVSDDGMAHLASLKYLEQLTLKNLPLVTDPSGFL